MIQMNNIRFYHEGDTVSNLDKSFFNSLKDKNITTRNYKRIAFIGSLSKNGRYIFSVPKYYSLNNNKLDIQLILDSIRKTAASIKSSSFIGKEEKEFLRCTHDMFPIEFFERIYGYYRNYGLYYKNIRNYKARYNGHISWKKTIERSPAFYGNGSFVYLPFRIRINKKVATFINYCMNSAIVYTLHQNRWLHLTYPYINYDHNLIKYHNYTAQSLEKISQKVFNSRIKRLIYNLIMFYKYIARDNNIYTTAPALIWEDAVQQYLDDHLDVNITIDKKIPYFRHKQFMNNNFKHQPKTKIIAGSLYDKGQKIKNPPSLYPDHVLYKGQNKLIFDSKYYKGVKSHNGGDGLELNMKQIVYHLYARQMYPTIKKGKKNKIVIMKPRYNVIDSVVLPTDDTPLEGTGNVYIYFHSRSIDGRPIKIYASYLNINNVLSNYIR